MEPKSGKQYGLIIAKRKQQDVSSKPSIFGNDSDSDNEKNIEKVIKKESLKKLSRKQTQLEMQRALDQDPTVYEYDSIYDDLKEQKETKKSEATSDRKPKYIEALLKTAEKRKKDYERRVERKIQVEREEEGEKFADKEAFVTSAYKKKMQELQEEEEKEKRMDVIEAMMDVTKQKDLSGFYRNLLKRQTDKDGASVSSVNTKTQVKEEPGGDNEVSNQEQEKRESKDKTSSSSKEKSLSHHSKESNPKPSQDVSTSATENKAREALITFRKANYDKDKAVPDNADKDKAVSDSADKNKAVPDDADADSDFSVDSESSSSDSSDEETSNNNPNVKKRKNSASPGSSPSSKKKIPSKAVAMTENGNQVIQQSKKEVITKMFSTLDEDSKSEDSEAESEKPVPSTEEKRKLLFTKRTVGKVYEAARERYLQRKEAMSAARLAFASVPVK